MSMYRKMRITKLDKKKVENALKISGLNKSELHRKTGIPLESIRRCFNRTLTIDTDYLYDLCVAMDIEPAYLIEDDDNDYDSYHEAKEIMEYLSDEDKERIDPDGIYVEHFSAKKANTYRSFEDIWYRSTLLEDYVQFCVQNSSVKNWKLARRSNDPCFISNVCMRIQHEVDKLVNDAIAAQYEQEKEIQ